MCWTRHACCPSWTLGTAASLCTGLTRGGVTSGSGAADAGRVPQPLSRNLTLLACRDEIMGLLLVKELIVIDKGAGVRAGEVRMRGLPHLQASIMGCLAKACRSLQKRPVLQVTD